MCSGSWKDKSFKAYNFDALGVPPTRGHLHPLMKVRTEIRQIFFEMGYVLRLHLGYCSDIIFLHGYVVVKVLIAADTDSAVAVVSKGETNSCRALM